MFRIGWKTFRANGVSFARFYENKRGMDHLPFGPRRRRYARSFLCVDTNVSMVYTSEALRDERSSYSNRSTSNVTNSRISEGRWQHNTSEHSCATRQHSGIYSAVSENVVRGLLRSGTLLRLCYFTREDVSKKQPVWCLIGPRNIVQQMQHCCWKSLCV